MSNYPPPYNSGRYSPGRPAYSDRPPFPPTLNNAPREHPPYPYSNSGPPPPTASYRTYDPYTNDSRPGPYPQPRDPYTADSYDPYSPSTAYPASRYPPNASPPRQDSRPIARPASPPRRVAQSAPRQSEGKDLNMLTPVVTATISGSFTTAIYSLPPSKLPLDKYIAVNPGDCIDIHRALCRKSSAVWYADGCSRAGEGWCAAIEWIIDMGQSGRKMRACIPGGDGLDAELGAICKAVEGFHELLELSIKQGTPMSHEMIIFCDSAAAIVAIDTSSRPESLRFDALWRRVCCEFLKAHITFVWLPKNSGIEGHVLADKIAMVAASNSYLKKKKEGTLAQMYQRHGGGEPMPSGSAEAGPWQRGDADPSRRKEVFERPQPAPVAMPEVEAAVEDEVMAEEDLERHRKLFGDTETHLPPPAESIFVTRTSVDIYHTDPNHPRFAYVQYTTLDSGAAAIDALHDRPIDFASPYAKENADDLADWAGWQGSMKVVRNGEGRFIPGPVEELFPGIAPWMVGKKAEVPAKEPDVGAKRSRSADGVNTEKSQSPKRPRQSSPGAVNFAAQLSDLVTSVALPAAPAAESSESSPAPPHVTPPSTHATTNGTTPQHALPPTPQTAERPSVKVASPEPNGLPTPTTAAKSAEPARPPLTNSAAEPQEYPIQYSVKTLRLLISLVSDTFTRHDVNNWIAHSCLIAVELDLARRALQADLYATDEGFLTGRELEQQLLQRGFTAPRVDAFITKVLKVLDGIALAEALEGGGEVEGEAVDKAEREQLVKQLETALERYPDQTKEAIHTAGSMMEYLHRGKELQEKKRLDVERRVKVLEGMVTIGEVVGGVVRFLLTEQQD